MAAAKRVMRLPFGARLVLTMDTEDALYVLQLTQKAVRDVRPLLTALAAVLREEARARFAEGGRNPKWQRLAPSTVAAKALMGMPFATPRGRIPRRLEQRGVLGAAGILIRTGWLRDSWGLKGHPDHVEQIDAKRGTVRIGSKAPYAAAHQQGTSAYTILASAGKALSFVGSGGQQVFRGKVNHPGLPARAVTISRDGLQKIRRIATAYLEGQVNAKRAAATAGAGGFGNTGFGLATAGSDAAALAAISRVAGLAAG